MPVPVPVRALVRDLALVQGLALAWVAASCPVCLALSLLQKGTKTNS